jgi:hypothetical protein
MYFHAPKLEAAEVLSSGAAFRPLHADRQDSGELPMSRRAMVITDGGPIISFLRVLRRLHLPGLYTPAGPGI